jgi:hypothetical protein
VEGSRLAAEALHSHQERRLERLEVWKQAGIEQVSESVVDTELQTSNRQTRGRRGVVFERRENRRYIHP